jgi:hypothetical protein
MYYTYLKLPFQQFISGKQIFRNVILVNIFYCNSMCCICYTVAPKTTGS